MKYTRTCFIILFAALAILLILAGCAPALPPVPPTPTAPPASQPSGPTLAATPDSTQTPPPAITPASTPLPVGYAVAFVAEGDVLNVRSAPGASNPVVVELPHDYGRDAGPLVFVIGPGQTVDGALWVPLQGGAFEGWVNRSYLTEAVYPSNFCDEAMGQSVLDGLLNAVAETDSEGLARLVHPQRGLLLRHDAWNREVQLSAEEVRGFFEDTTPRDFGLTYGQNEQVIGSTAEVIVPILTRDMLDPNREIGCSHTEAGLVNTYVFIPAEYGALNYYTIMRPPIDLQENAFDWGIWAVGIEFWEGQPYLAYLVHYQWEP